MIKYEHVHKNEYINMYSYHVNAHTLCGGIAVNTHTPRSASGSSKMLDAEEAWVWAAISAHKAQDQKVKT